MSTVKILARRTTANYLALFEEVAFRSSTRRRKYPLQVGSEVSNVEQGRQLGLDKKTVDRYLDLLTKVFIIHQVGGFSRNL